MQRRFFNPRKPPFGYPISEQDSGWQIVLGMPEEVDVVRWLFSAFDRPDGTPSPSGTKWRLSEVRKALRNRAYGGFSKEPPLVSVEQFERVQNRLGGR